MSAVEENFRNCRAEVVGISGSENDEHVKILCPLAYKVGKLLFCGHCLCNAGTQTIVDELGGDSGDGGLPCWVVRKLKIDVK